MKTVEAIELLAKRHSEARGKWANIVEFLGIDFAAVGLWPSLGYSVYGYEIKVSRSDWLRELRQPNKSFASMKRCDFWIVAAPPGVVKVEEVPPKWGYLELCAAPRIKVKPQRLRVETNSTNKYEREAFALLARRYAYANADRTALLGLFPTRPVEALDLACRATGRFTSVERQRQRRRAKRRRPRS